jgi:PHP family Zn ribbon phosphoesterase
MNAKDLFKKYANTYYEDAGEYVMDSEEFELALKEYDKRTCKCGAIYVLTGYAFIQKYCPYCGGKIIEKGE